jgi:GntR family transcriptional regulator of arabinose operon
MNISGEPIYQQLVGFYKTRIIGQEMQPGSKIDSIEHIIRRHKVSRETAKRVQKELSDLGYVRRVVGKGTFVSASQTIEKKWGMVIPFYSSNIEELIRHLTIHARNSECELNWYFTYNNPEEEKRLVAEMVLKGFEAIIVIPNYNEELTAGFYRRLMPGNTSIILVDNTMAGSYFKYVIQSYDLGIARSIDYLALKNPGNLLLVKNEDWRGRNMVFELMERSFLDRVLEKYPKRKAFTLESSRHFEKDFLHRNQITGIISCTDTDSCKILVQLRKWNMKVPDGISLISYGNTELTEYFTPSITVLDCGYAEMAEKTADLIRKGKNCGFFEQHIVFPKIVERET